MCSGSLHASDTCVNHGLTFPASIEFTAVNSGESSAFAAASKPLGILANSVAASVSCEMKNNSQRVGIHNFGKSEVVLENTSSIKSANSTVSSLLESDLEKKVRRKLLYNARYIKSRLSLGSDRSCNCGKFGLSTEVGIAVNGTTKSARFTGVETCNSVWECPVCRERIMRERQEELQSISDFWGHSNTALLTLTIPHHAGQSLNELKGDSKQKTGLKGSFRRMLASRAWRKLSADYGIVGMVRAIEPNYGYQNGWHPHYHLILFFGQKSGDVFEPSQFFDTCLPGLVPSVAGKVKEQERRDLVRQAEKSIQIPDSMTRRDYVQKLDSEKMNALQLAVYDIWKDCCLASGLKEPSPKHGVKVTNGAASYIAKWGAGGTSEKSIPSQKWGAAQELTAAGAKTGKSGNHHKTFSVYELEAQLVDLCASVEGRFKGRITRNALEMVFDDPQLYEFNYLIRLLDEYYNSMRGSRLLEWSRAFKKFIDNASLDEEIELLAEDDTSGEGDKDEIIGYLKTSVYMRLYHRNKLHDLLRIVELGGESLLLEFLRHNGQDLSHYRRHSLADELDTG